MYPKSKIRINFVIREVLLSILIKYFLNINKLEKKHC